MAFYLDTADERKERYEKMETERGIREKETGGEMRGRQEKKGGVLFERLSWSSLNYITEMLQH